MAVAPEQLIEQSTRHSVYVQRLATSEVNKFEKYLKRIDRSIRDRLAKGELTDYTRDRLERLLESVDKDLSEIYVTHGKELQSDLIELGIYESEFESRSLNNVVGFETVIPAATQVRAAINTSPMSARGPDGGKLLAPFIKDLSRKEVDRIKGVIRQGAFEGQTNSQIIRVIRGTKANQFRDGILQISNRNAAAMVRTAVQHVAGVARQATWDANADIVEGIRWVSTLDSRACPQCMSMDGREFDIDKGPRPPLHVGCRCTTTARLNDEFAFLDEGRTRFARGPDGVGRVDANETYYSWLKKQPAEFQNNAIGPTRAKLLRDGGLTAERFSELNIGRNFRALNLSQMRAIESTAFEKAGL